MKFIVYSKDNCKYCEMAKTALQDFIHSYGKFAKNKDLLSITYICESFTVEDLKQKFHDMGLMPPKTVPCIFYKEDIDSKETFVGGYSELTPFLDMLKEKLNANN